MGKYIKQNTSTSGAYGNIKINSATKLMRAEILSKVTIPMYFYNIIIPQLGDYYDNYTVDFENKPVVCCPLHDEDTPSFRYYEHTQSCYCFGCSRGGTVINLHKYFAERMNGVMPSEDEAISFLYNFFIKNKETETFVKQPIVTKSETKENNNVDIVKFNIYRINLEKSITFDTSISLERKKKIWELLDNIDCLLDLSMVDVKDAEQYIKLQLINIIK